MVNNVVIRTLTILLKSHDGDIKIPSTLFNTLSICPLLDFFPLQVQPNASLSISFIFFRCQYEDDLSFSK